MNFFEDFFLDFEMEQEGGEGIPDHIPDDGIIAYLIDTRQYDPVREQVVFEERKIERHPDVAQGKHPLELLVEHYEQEPDHEILNLALFLMEQGVDAVELGLDEKLEDFANQDGFGELLAEINEQRANVEPEEEDQEMKD